MLEQSRQTTKYQELIKKTQPPVPVEQTTENELDRLLITIEDRKRREHVKRAAPRVDPILALREKVIRELVPAFVDLVEKYGRTGVAMQMDASNLLEGGRELNFEFAFGTYRMELQGTVVTDAIAFHEVRHAPDLQGQMVAGPMLRLKTLSAKSFREFICGRIMVLIRLANRRR